MKKKLSKNVLPFIIPILVAIFNGLIILFPSDIISAAKEGISLWFNNVFPSLLPFIIGTNILIGLGAVNFIGTLLQPIMQPLFGVPGCGGFALITGLTSGYPMGAKTAALLREKKTLSKIEAQRLISFVNNSGPLFILGAVGIGMFKSASVGYFLITVHYSAAIVTGLIFKYYKWDGKKISHDNDKLLSKAINSMHTARQKDGSSAGEIIGDSVKNAMETMAQIGGFIILFCVIIKVFEITNFVTVTEKMLNPLLQYFGISHEHYKGLFIGIMEVTNGTKILSASSFSKTQLLIAAAIISFGGFSIHAQSLSFISKTDINTALYIFSKFIHSMIALLLGSLIFPIFHFSTEETIQTSAFTNKQVFDKLAYSSMLFVLSILLIIGIILVFNITLVLRRPKKYH